MHGCNVVKNEGGKVVFIKRVDFPVPEPTLWNQKTEDWPQRAQRAQRKFSCVSVPGMAHRLRRGLQDIRSVSQSSVISVACFCFQGVVTRRLTGMRPPCESITYIFTLGRIFSIASR